MLGEKIREERFGLFAVLVLFWKGLGRSWGGIFLLIEGCGVGAEGAY